MYSFSLQKDRPFSSAFLSPTGQQRAGAAVRVSRPHGWAIKPSRREWTGSGSVVVAFPPNLKSSMNWSSEVWNWNMIWGVSLRDNCLCACRLPRGVPGHSLVACSQKKVPEFRFCDEDDLLKREGGEERVFTVAWLFKGWKMVSSFSHVLGVGELNRVNRRQLPEYRIHFENGLGSEFCEVLLMHSTTTWSSLPDRSRMYNFKTRFAQWVLPSSATHYVWTDTLLARYVFRRIFLTSMWNFCELSANCWTYRDSLKGGP